MRRLLAGLVVAFALATVGAAAQSQQGTITLPGRALPPSAHQTLELRPSYTFGSNNLTIGRLVTINGDTGAITYHEGYTPDTAARTLWEAISHVKQRQVVVEISEAMQAGIELALAETPEDYPAGATVVSVVTDVCLSGLSAYATKTDAIEEGVLLKEYRGLSAADKAAIRRAVIEKRESARGRGGRM